MLVLALLVLAFILWGQTTIHVPDCLRPDQDIDCPFRSDVPDR